jgi:hypothetical protein
VTVLAGANIGKVGGPGEHRRAAVKLATSVVDLDGNSTAER